MTHSWRLRCARLVFACCVVAPLGLASRTSAAQTTYRRADIDSTGQLRIVVSNGRVIRPQKDSDQVAFDQPGVSADHRIVGWVALYPNCCTSYPIPLALVLLRASGGRTVIGNGFPIWQWAFAPDGRAVVIRQAPVHGDAPTHYELRDIETRRVIAEWDSDSTTSRTPAWIRPAMPPRARSPERGPLPDRPELRPADFAEYSSRRDAHRRVVRTFHGGARSAIVCVSHPMSSRLAVRRGQHRQSSRAPIETR